MNIDAEQKDGKNGKTSNNEGMRGRMKERSKSGSRGGGGFDYERGECRERMGGRETDWEGWNIDSNIY